MISWSDIYSFYVSLLETIVTAHSFCVSLEWVLHFE